MGKQRKRRIDARPRKPVVGGPDREASYYVVRFIVKTPSELDLPEYVAKESPPTMDLGEARAAFNQLVSMMGSGEAQAAGLRSPQLVERTVTEVVLEDYDRGQAATMADEIDERIDEAQQAADADYTIDAGNPEYLSAQLPDGTVVTEKSDGFQPPRPATQPDPIPTFRDRLSRRLSNVAEQIAEDVAP